MPRKKTVIVEQKLPKKKPAKAFVQQEPAPFEHDETFENQFDAQEDTQAESAPRKAQDKQPVRRTPLNHANGGGMELDGMKFVRSRGILDGTSKKTLDIDPACLNPNLSYYWTNDEKGLVDQRVELGYQVVPQLKSRTGEKISTRRRVGTQKDGSPLEAVLMATPKNWKKERMDAQENERQKLEGALRTGSSDGQEKLGKEFYIHKETVIE